MKDYSCSVIDDNWPVEWTMLSAQSCCDAAERYAAEFGPLIEGLRVQVRDIDEMNDETFWIATQTSYCAVPA